MTVITTGQRLQYTEWQKEQIRERAQADPENHYTYSQTFLSGSLCPVNAEELEQTAEREKRTVIIATMRLTNSYSYGHSRERPTLTDAHAQAVGSPRQFEQ